VRKLPIGQKRAHLLEVQVNGGTTAAKVDFAYSMFEKVRPGGERGFFGGGRHSRLPREGGG
jgi:hypothetical protein